MITVGFSTREDNQEFISYLKTTSGVKDIEVIQKINNGDKSLAQVYNEVIDESTNNIVVLCHDDILFDTKNWAKNLLRNFDKTGYDIIGLAGSSYLPESGKWWEHPMTMRGIVNHSKDGKKWESKYSTNNGKMSPTVMIDGLFIAFDKDYIKQRFNEDLKGFHFYDVDFSFRNYLEGVNVGVTYDVRVTHLSIGETNEQWELNRQQFVETYKDKLPTKIEEDADLTTFVMCHDQSIIKMNIKSKKFDSLGNVTFMYVGKGEFENKDQYPNVIVVRDLKHNIEEYPSFTAFTAWYAIWRQGLCKTKYINLLEYDVNLKDDYSFFLKNVIKLGPKVISYFPMDMRNYHYVQNPDWVTSIFKGILGVYKINMLDVVAQVVNTTVQQNRQPVWSTTNNVCLETATFDKYMRWVSPLIGYMKDDIYSGHNQERGLSFFTLLNNVPTYFFQGYIEHVQADSHKTQGHEVTKEVEL